MIKVKITDIGISVVVLVLFTACKQKHDKAVERDQKPNILWIVSEDNSPWIGAYCDSLAQTPNLDKLAANGILFTNAYSNAPVCAPSRCTLITGMYANGLGTQHMRSTYSIPDSIRFYPEFLRKAGYYTTNNVKKDYNTIDRPQAWDESSKTATYKSRKKGQPFFHIQNLTISHESRLHFDSIPKTPTERVKLYPYHPDTPEMRKDYAVYYDRMQDLDMQIGEILNELEKEGLADETIVFYYADHGGPIAGTKRFATQQGLQVPLIVRIPEKYRHLTAYESGQRVNRPLSFIDFPPTLMQIANIEIPKQFQGKPFLQPDDHQDLVFGFAGRMDESMNMVRTVTDGKYRYTRNYFPKQPYGTHIQTLWKAPGMRSWHDAFLAGKTNAAQSAFFEARPYEELYDIENDQYQINNLVSDTQFSKVKGQLSQALTQWQLDIGDTGFIPELMLQDADETGHAYSYSQSEDYPITTIMALVEKVNTTPNTHREAFLEALASDNTVIQFWAAQGFLNVNPLSAKETITLKKRMGDARPEIGMVLAEVLFQNDEQDHAIAFLNDMLNDEKLMNRVQALNAISRFSAVPKELKEKLKEIGAQQEGRKRPYDARIANYLLAQF